MTYADARFWILRMYIKGPEGTKRNSSTLDRPQKHEKGVLEQ